MAMNATIYVPSLDQNVDEPRSKSDMAKPTSLWHSDNEDKMMDTSLICTRTVQELPDFNRLKQIEFCPDIRYVCTF